MTGRAEELDEIEARLNAATPGEWRAMRDGNQYVDIELDSRKGKNMIHPKGRNVLVGASRVDGLQRPWNPWWVGDSTSPETQETVRLKDADADFVANSKSDIRALLDIARQAITLGERDELEKLRARVQQIEYPCSPHCDGYLQELALRNSMTQSRDAILEEAAKVAETMPDQVLCMWDRHGGPPGNGYAEIKGQRIIAQYIRALQGKPSTRKDGE